MLFGPGAERAFAQDGEGHAEDPGRSVYEESCVRCHRDGGRGVEGVFPSLRDNDLVRGSSEALVIMVLEGRAAMPGFAETLSDQEIAAVVSYLRSNWGNEAKRIAEDEIAEVRKQVETPASRPRPGTHDEG
ncbi:MAG: c-type cytochrome [Gemmatimonadota bacterium]